MTWKTATVFLILLNGVGYLRVCDAKLWGEFCEDKCSAQCGGDGSCDKDTAECAEGCVTGYVKSSQLVCEKCGAGQWGDGCGQKCGQCFGSPCRHDNGKCEDGCKAGFAGPMCTDLRKEISSTAGPSLSKASVSASPGMIAAGAGVLSLIVLVVVLFIVSRRRNRRSDLTAESGPSYGKEVFSFTASDPRLDSLDSVLRYLVDRLSSGKQLAAEFSDIKRAPDGVTQHVGERENGKKNRFQQVVPYDKNRIVLQDGYKEGLATDYVNASYITGYHGSKQFIASQGPQPNTVGDFWRMVWQEKARHVVMVTNISEEENAKCVLYWPNEEGATQKYGPVSVTTTYIQCRDNFFVRTFIIKRDGSDQSREVTQYHLTTWPDNGFPTTTSFVRFYRYVRGRTETHGVPMTSTSTSSIGKSGCGRAPPVVVHCSAGVGRTGTYIGLDIGIDRAVKDGTLDVLDLVTSLREERSLMVQTVNQYKFLHKALIEAYSAHGTNMSVDAFDELFTKKIDSESPHPRLDKEFRTLRQMLILQADQRNDDARLKENITKIRDPAFLPSNSHLFHLNEQMAGRNQFINAVFAPTLRDPQGFVVTQLPLPDTLVDFWRLVYGNAITTIVSLSAPNEETEVKPHCQYWPISAEGSVVTGPYKITLLSKIQLPGSEVTAYSLQLVKEGDTAEPKSLQLLHYKGWTGEVGGRSSDILHLIDTLDTSRLVVQCSDGVRKSGLFCTLVNVVDRMTFDRKVDVYMTIRHLQSGMPKAISSAAQYRYCYEVAQSRVREIASLSPGHTAPTEL